MRLFTGVFLIFFFCSSTSETKSKDKKKGKKGETGSAIWRFLSRCFSKRKQCEEDDVAYVPDHSPVYLDEGPCISVKGGEDKLPCATIESWKQPQPVCATIESRKQTQPVCATIESWKQPQPVCATIESRKQTQPVCATIDSWKQTPPICATIESWKQTQPVCATIESWKQTQPVCAIIESWKQTQHTSMESRKQTPPLCAITESEKQTPPAIKDKNAISEYKKIDSVLSKTEKCFTERNRELASSGTDTSSDEILDLVQNVEIQSINDENLSDENVKEDNIEDEKQTLDRELDIIILDFENEDVQEMEICEVKDVEVGCIQNQDQSDDQLESNNTESDNHSEITPVEAMNGEQEEQESTPIEAMNCEQEEQEITTNEAMNCEQEQETTPIEAMNCEQEITPIEAMNCEQEQETTPIEAMNCEQEQEITSIEAMNCEQEQETTPIEAMNCEQKEQEITPIEAMNCEQEQEITPIEAMNCEQEQEITTNEAMNCQQEEQAATPIESRNGDQDQVEITVQERLSVDETTSETLKKKAEDDIVAAELDNHGYDAAQDSMSHSNECDIERQPLIGTSILQAEESAAIYPTKSSHDESVTTSPLVKEAEYCQYQERQVAQVAVDVPGDHAVRRQSRHPSAESRRQEAETTARHYRHDSSSPFIDWMVRAYFSQNSRARLGTLPWVGFQCTSASVSAITLSSVMSPLTWTSITLGDILRDATFAHRDNLIRAMAKRGGNQNIDAVRQCQGPISKEIEVDWLLGIYELPRVMHLALCHTLMGDNQISSEIDHQNSVFGTLSLTLDLDQVDAGFLSLSKALENALQDPLSLGVLITLSINTLAIMRADEYPGLFLYDSHNRDGLGRPEEGNNGRSLLAHFENIDLLIAHLTSIFGAVQFFELTPVRRI